MRGPNRYKWQIEKSKKYGFKVVYASSSSVYGNPIRIPIKESDGKNPINPYAETKLKKEEFYQVMAKLEVLSFPGEIIVVSERSQISDVISILSKETHLGFDSGWNSLLSEVFVSMLWKL